MIIGSFTLLITPQTWKDSKHESPYRIEILPLHRAATFKSVRFLDLNFKQGLEPSTQFLGKMQINLILVAF
jgi:hypothetical protein